MALINLGMTTASAAGIYFLMDSPTNPLEPIKAIVFKIYRPLTIPF